MNTTDKKSDLQKEKDREVYQPDDRMNAARPAEGSVQEALLRCIGRNVIVEFLMGNDNMVSKSGLLYEVAASYITLYDETAGAYIICDFCAIKFVTLTDPSKRSQRRR
ncbi:MAG TPA: hypothetical protein VN446_05950 [Candidatus Acidoferrum sp.]|nr:hypothetical protein [Candidatus Acidoferrum sp.]